MTPSRARLAVQGTDLVIARVGFGCARLFGGSETRASARLIEEALAAGFSHFDTAPSYAYGQSEGLLGEVLGDMPGVTITTKVGLTAVGAPSRAGSFYRRLVRPVLGRAPALKAALLSARERPVPQNQPPPRRVLGTEEIEASLAASLTRLQRTRIDILLVHEPDQFVIDAALKERFENLKRNGTILAYGLGYGGSAPPAESFGHVLQEAYDQAAPPTDPANATAIYHGILRHRGAATPREALRAVIHVRPRAGLLVSASTRSQIRDIAAQVRAAADQPISTSAHED